MVFKPNIPPSRQTRLKSTDARVLGTNAQYLLTSANMSFLPMFYPGPRPLRPRCNGKFGPEDYTLHPQMYFELYPWLPCVTRPPDDVADLAKHPFCPLWWHEPLSVWQATPAHVFTGQGHMAEEDWLVLREVVHRIDRAAASAEYLRPPLTFSTTRTAMLAALERLRFLPMTRADFVLQFAQCQRMALDVDAMTMFLLKFAPRIRQQLVSYDVDTRLMGCFTNNPTVAENLHKAGIPFWLIRDMRLVPVGTISVMTVKEDFAMASYAQGKEFTDDLTNPISTPFKTVGVYGHQVERIERTRTMGRMYSSLVQFEEGPQEYVSEDNQDILNTTPSFQQSVTTTSITPRMGPRLTQVPFLDRESQDQDFSDDEQDGDIFYPYQPMQDSPTSPSPAPSSRASSIPPVSHASLRPISSYPRSVAPSSSRASSTAHVISNHPRGVGKRYPHKRSRKSHKSKGSTHWLHHHSLTLNQSFFCSRRR